MRLLATPDAGPDVTAWLLAWPTGARQRDEVRRGWQALLAALPGGPGGVTGPEPAPAPLGGPRVGWRTASGLELRVSYGQWPADASPAPAGIGPVGGVVLLAWRRAASGCARWAVDVAPAWHPPEGGVLLALYGSPTMPEPDDGPGFGRAWATVEATAKLWGGLREDASGAMPARVLCRQAGAWCLAFAEV